MCSWTGCEVLWGFRSIVQEAGTEPGRARRNLNAHSERFNRSLREECLDRMIFFRDNSLRRAIP
jgi:hypothetical protein